MAVDQPDGGAARRHAGTPSAMLPEGAKLEVVTTAGDLLALAPHWRALEAVAAHPRHVFQSFGWCGSWACHYLTETPAATLATVVGWLDGRLVMVWPLMITRHGPFRVLRWLSDPVGQYGDVLIAPDLPARPWFAQAWRMIRAHAPLDAIFLRHVRADAAVYPFLSEHSATSPEREYALYLDLSRFSDGTAYDRRYDREQRRRRQRIQRKLEALGPLHFELEPLSCDLAATVDWTLSEKHHWLAERGLFSPVLSDRRFQAFLRDLGQTCEHGPVAVAATLRCGSRPAASEIAFHYRGGHFCYLTAHDRRLHDLSPARLHLHYSQKWCLENGLTLFDLMAPGDDYKASWSNATVEVADFLAPVSGVGRFYSQVYLRHLRPRIRTLYRHLDRRIRRPVATLLRRLDRL